MKDKQRARAHPLFTTIRGEQLSPDENDVMNFYLALPLKRGRLNFRHSVQEYHDISLATVRDRGVTLRGRDHAALEGGITYLSDFRESRVRTIVVVDGFTEDFFFYNST